MEQRAYEGALVIRGDMGEIWVRYGGDMGEIWGRYGGDVGRTKVLSSSGVFSISCRLMRATFVRVRGRVRG